MPTSHGLHWTVALLLPLFLGCGASAPAVRAESAPTPSQAAPPASSYGRSEDAPIRVGGGPDGQREYLSHLRGPDGQKVRFRRVGSCCGYQDASLPMGFGMLDVFEVTYEGLAAPVTLYLDMYRRELGPAPEGFRLDAGG